MMQINDVATYIADTLRAVLCGDYKDVQRVRLYSHYIEHILVSLINANRLQLFEGDCLVAINKMTELGLLSTDVASFYCKYRGLIDSNLPLGILSDWSCAHHIHERLLSCELNVSEKDVWFSSGKVSRDNTGSYYTPSDLSLEVVREAIKKHLCINGIENDVDAKRVLEMAKFADLSCGCGEFIRAVRTELTEQYNIKTDVICRNIYGIDIDPIALQITVCDVLAFTSANDWRDIISHFVLGNPLIEQLDEKDLACKTRLFATGRFYNCDMGINMRQVFANDQINIVVGNPPWEKVRFEERKFFKPIMPEISDIPQKNKRQASIGKLKNYAPLCYEWYVSVSEDYNNFKNEIKRHRYIARSLNGELNTYALFTELSLSIVNKSGVIALLVKSAIATSPANKPFFTYLLKQQNIASICLFKNSLRIFDIDSREQFCVITCTQKPNPSFELIAGATKVEELHSVKRISLTAQDMKIINPYTQMLPSISENADIQILLTAHKKFPLFDTVYPLCHYGRLVHLTSHADYIDTELTLNNVPVYEGKFIERYDARFATFADVPFSKKYSAKAHAKKTVSFDGKKPLPECRYFIQKEFWTELAANYDDAYMLCWRSLTSSTNKRTMLAMLLPTMPTCQSIQFLQTSNVTDLLIILALFNSKAFDFFVRLKMPGIDLTQSVIRQIPVPSKDAYQRRIRFSNVVLPLEQHILERVTAIVLHEPLLASMLNGINMPSETIRKKSKPTLERELDDLFFIAYEFLPSEIIEVQNKFKE
jgi:hypothetical protein